MEWSRRFDNMQKPFRRPPKLESLQRAVKRQGQARKVQDGPAAHLWRPCRQWDVLFKVRHLLEPLEATCCPF